MNFVSLRPATWDDANDLLKWKNDPVMRQFSIVTHDEISLDDHLIWLGEHLNEILIIENNGVAVGDIRVSGGEVAIKLDQASRGCGLGKIALTMVQASHKSLVAKIADGNIASMRLFLGCSFMVYDYKPGYYLLRWDR